MLLIGPLGTNFNEISIEIDEFFIQENPFRNVAWKMASILSRSQCVRHVKQWGWCSKCSFVIIHLQHEQRWNTVDITREDTANVYIWMSGYTHHKSRRYDCGCPALFQKSEILSVDNYVYPFVIFSRYFNSNGSQHNTNRNTENPNWLNTILEFIP